MKTPGEVRRFGYTQSSPELRTAILGLQLYSGFEGAAVLALLLLFVPGYWRYVTVAGLLGLYAWLFGSMRGLLISAHATSPEGLELHVGTRFRRMIPWEMVAGVSPARITPPPLTLGLHLRLDPASRTLLLVTGRAHLLELTLVEPMEAHLRWSKGPVERVIFTVDEPEGLLTEVERWKGVLTNPDGRERADAGTPPETLLTAPPAGASPLAFPRRMGPGAEEALRLSDVTRRFGDFTAVDRVSLSVYRGEVFGFVGPNGAGKTTTLRMMTGLLLPSSGRIEINGRDVWKEPLAAKEAFGYVADTPVFYERLTVEEFLAFIADLRRIPEEEARGRVRETLSLFELEGKAASPIHSLSLGNRRRLALAAAFLPRPPVLLLDEPTNGLDPRSARQVKDLLLGYRNAGGAVFLTTHLLGLAEEVCDRLGIIHQGRLRAVGSLSELREVAGGGASLEEVFLRLTERRAETS